VDMIAGHSTVETVYDPSLVRVPGKHTAFFQMLAPGVIEGDWDKRHAEIEGRVMAKWSEYVENLEGNVIIKSSETPVDIERRLPSMHRGSIKHGDYNILQMGYMRPNDLCSRTDTPVPGLYVCGASTYPGGLVIGGPGYVAANKVVKDMEANKWWKLPDYVQKYVEEYIK
jgi:phytoene dehydrogenase-like protein